MGKLVLLGVICALLPLAEAFSARAGVLVSRRPSSAVAMGPRALHKEFTVAKATPEQISELGVKNWGVWSTAGSAKYKTGVKSPLKVYDGNELSYIISGKMEITPVATGVPVLVQAGDFVTFPDEFECYWFVIEEIVKNYYLY
jgi:uncharacterized cupin superfamily protein